MSATELTPAMLREMGCISGSVQWVLDDEGSGSMEFAKKPPFVFGDELIIEGKHWWVKNLPVSHEGETKTRWTVDLEDEEARLNTIPYLGNPDGSGMLATAAGTNIVRMVSRAKNVANAITLSWREESPMLPIPALTGGESIGDIKHQLLQWAPRNCPPAGGAPVGTLLRYETNSKAHAKGEIRMNFNRLPVGGLRSGIFVGNREVRVAAPANAAGLAAAINADSEFSATATASGTRINLTAKTAGEAGNDIRLGVSADEGEVVRSGDNLTGGADSYTETYIVPATPAYLNVELEYPSVYGPGLYAVFIGGREYLFKKDDVQTPAAELTAAINEDTESVVIATVDTDHPSKVIIEAKETGASGNAITLSLLDLYDYQVSGPFLTGGSATKKAQGWVDCCTGELVLDGTTYKEPASGGPYAWAEIINASGDFICLEGYIDIYPQLKIDRVVPGLNPITYAGLGSRLIAIYNGTDETTAERTVPAVAATGWIDLGTTGTHPRVQHTGLFINGVELLGHALSTADVVRALNDDNRFGVTADLTSGSVADSIVYLTAREEGAPGNEISLLYSGDEGVELSGAYLTGGTLGDVATLGRLFGGANSKPVSMQLRPRYDLLCPAAGLFGKYNYVVPRGASLSQPRAFAYHVPGHEIVSAENAVTTYQSTGGSMPDSYLPDVRNAAGQLMEVRGRRVPTGWSIKGGSAPVPGQAHDFWTKLPAFHLLDKLGIGNLEYHNSMTFFPVAVDKAYPEETEGEDTLPPPANYKAITDGNLYLLVQGSFPGSSKSSNNPSGLHFCQGTLRQTVFFTGDTANLPSGVKAEDVESFFSDTAARQNGKLARCITLVLTGIFIDRRVKRYYTGSSADAAPTDSGGGGGGGGTVVLSAANDAEKNAYIAAINAYYASHSQLYTDATVQMLYTPGDVSPQEMLGAQLVVEEGQTTSCPVRRVTLDLLTRRMTVEAGSPDLLSFDDMLERRKTLKKSISRQVSYSTAKMPHITLT